MRNLKNVFAMALVTGLAFTASAEVLAQRGGGRGQGNGPGMNRPTPNRPGPVRPGRPGQNDQYEIESAFIGKTLSNQKLFLGRELGLRMEQGKEIEKVTLEISGMRRGGSMQLTINGQDVSRTQQFRGGRVGEQTIEFKLHRPFVIGQNVQRIQVEVFGTAYIESASVLLKKQGRHGGGQGRQAITNHPFERVFGIQSLDLAELSNANFRQERRQVRMVELEIENFDRAAQIRLCTKDDFNFRAGDFGFRGHRRTGGHSMNCQNTQLVRGFGTQSVRLFANAEELEDLELLVRGTMTIKKVTVRFDRR
ncbi:MAG: hypothetical protein NXH75_08180 [Halobacteriovoraceae bacterium]|nr:hypothetical protein [Halobacteriovoraceae bacterium]